MTSLRLMGPAQTSSSAVPGIPFRHRGVNLEQEQIKPTKGIIFILLYLYVEREMQVYI